jgi:ubiquinone/menaquinone biosynthesis C-methylase UbiE
MSEASSPVQPHGTEEWGADFFGTLNQMPPEPVAAIAQVLEAMRTEPVFQRARREMLQLLGVTAQAMVLDVGCGTGAALPNLIDLAGREVRVTGIDPTEAFLALARERAARLGAAGARYERGDARALPLASAEYDAAFCDKLLLHVGPPGAVLGEMVRVIRPGGRIGALEWHPYFVISTSSPDLEAKFNRIFRQAVYDYMASANLARYFQAAGLRDIQTRAYLASTESLDAHPFWRAFLIHQIPLFTHAGLISEQDGQAFITDIEDLNRRGVFRASCVVQIAVGTKP